MPNRPNIPDLNSIALQPQAQPSDRFFLAQAPRIDRGYMTDFQSLASDFAKIYGHVALQEREEDIKYGESSFAEQQARYSELLAKKETTLKGFAELISKSRMMDAHSPGAAIGFRRASGRLLANNYRLRAQEALTAELDQNFGLDPETNLPKAPRTPEEVLGQVQGELDGQAKLVSNGWLLNDYYVKNEYEDLKSKYTYQLQAEARDQYLQKQQQIHKDMVAVEGVDLLIKLWESVGTKDPVTGKEITLEDVKPQFQAFAKDKIWLASIPKPTEFALAMIKTASDNIKKRSYQGAASFYEAMADTTLGPVNLKKVYASKVDDDLNSIKSEEAQALQRQAAVFEIKRNIWLDNQKLNPDSDYRRIMGMLTEPDGPLKAFEALNNWYTLNKTDKGEVGAYADHFFADVSSRISTYGRFARDGVAADRTKKNILLAISEGDQARALNLIETASPEDQGSLYRLLNDTNDETVKAFKEQSGYQALDKDLKALTTEKALLSQGVDRPFDEASYAKVSLENQEDYVTWLEGSQKIIRGPGSPAEKQQALEALKKEQEAKISVRTKELAGKWTSLNAAVEAKWNGNQSAFKEIQDARKAGIIDERNYRSFIDDDNRRIGWIKSIKTGVVRRNLKPRLSAVIAEDTTGAFAAAGFYQTDQSGNRKIVGTGQDYLDKVMDEAEQAAIKDRTNPENAEKYADPTQADFLTSSFIEDYAAKRLFEGLSETATKSENLLGPNALSGLLKTLEGRPTPAAGDNLVPAYELLESTDKLGEGPGRPAEKKTALNIEKLTREQAAVILASNRRGQAPGFHEAMDARFSSGMYFRDAARLGLPETPDKVKGTRYPQLSKNLFWAEQNNNPAWFSRSTHERAIYIAGKDAQEGSSISNPNASILVAFEASKIGKPSEVVYAWKVFAQTEAKRASAFIIKHRGSQPDSGLEAALASTRSLTGHTFEELRTGMYRTGSGNLPITDYGFINPFVTPLFTPGEFRESFSDNNGTIVAQPAVKALMQKLGLNPDKDLQDFYRYQQAAINRAY